MKTIAKGTKYNYINMLEEVGLSPEYLAIDTVELEKSESFKEYHQLIN